MSKLDPAVIEAASIRDEDIPLIIPGAAPAYELDIRKERRARRVSRALAEHMPEDAVEKAARVHWSTYNQMSQSDKKSVLDLTERTIAAFLKHVGEME